MKNKILSSRIIKNIFKVYFGDIFSKILGVISTILIIRTLSPLDYAKFTNFLAVSSFIFTLTSSGINKGLVVYSVQAIEKGNEKDYYLLLRTGVLIEFFLVFIVAIIAYLFSRDLSTFFFEKDIYTNSIKLGSLSALGLIGLEIIRTSYQIREDFNNYVYVLIWRQFIFLIIILIFYLFNNISFIKVAYAAILSYLIVVIVSYRNNLLFRSSINSFLKKRFYLIKEFVLSTGWLVLYMFFLALFSQLDIFMLSRLESEIVLANYGVAFRYYSMALLILSSIHAVLLPKFSKTLVNREESNKKFLLNWFKLSLIIIPIFIILFFISPAILNFINGEEYYNASLIFKIFIIGIYLSLFLSPLVNLLIGEKKFKYLACLGFLALSTNFILNWLFIPIWSGKGAASATVISHHLVLHGGVLIYLKKRYF
ncbi:oligosaccharide flippase family protein [Lutibacter sp.]